MIKYRIKKKCFKDGTINYYPQYKKFLFWRNFYDYLWETYGVSFSTYELAKNYIEENYKPLNRQKLYE